MTSTSNTTKYPGGSVTTATRTVSKNGKPKKITKTSVDTNYKTAKTVATGTKTKIKKRGNVKTKNLSARRVINLQPKMLKKKKK